MRLLFILRHAGYVRNFESTIRLAARRGHQVHLAFEGRPKYEQLDPIGIADRLAAEHPTITHGLAPVRADGWGLLGRELRLGLDYLRYFNPEYADAPRLRERAERSAPPAIVERARRRARPDGSVPRAGLEAWLRLMNRAIAPDPAIDAWLREQRPDLLVVTPLVEPGAPQAEYLRAARALGLRTAYCAASWDNLTNKGLIHGPVDLVAVWNDAMKEEALALHGVPESRVVVTGAQPFDHWFTWTVREPREAFCARVGLPADRPYLLYLGSSRFVAPDEAAFMPRWLAAVRAEPALRDVGILIRPHPQNAEQWADVDLRAFGPVVVWPKAGAAPVDADSRSDYYDSMRHSAAVIGVNTTAEIESAIVGRPVFTVLAPEFRDTQAGTLHFQHLREVNGGLLRLAEDLPAHVAQLAGALRNPAEGDERCRRFVSAFVRPFGLDSPATPRLVDALEQLASRPAPAPEAAPAWAARARERLAPRVAELEQAAAERRTASEVRQAAKREREARKSARDAERRAALADRVAAERARRSGRETPVKAPKVEVAIVDFTEMDEARRCDVLRGIGDAIPHEAYLDLIAAAPPQPLDYPRADIRLRVSARAETFRLRACAKEPFTVEWIEGWIRQDEVLYDLGANVGAYSLIAAMKPGAGARVFAFEASLASVAALSANVTLNGVEGRVTPVPVALSDRTALGVFGLRDTQPGAARHALGGEVTEDGPPVSRQPVLMFRLDDLVGQLGLPSPHHIKLDVDGGELAVLQGAAGVLASPALRSVLVEVSTALSGPVTETLEGHGLALRDKVAVRNKAGEFAVWYGLFAREARP